MSTDELDAIRNRAEMFCGVLGASWDEEAQTDRRTLLRLLDAAREELREAEAANTALKDLCLAAGDLYKGGGVFPIKGAMALRLLSAAALKEKP